MFASIGAAIGCSYSISIEFIGFLSKDVPSKDLFFFFFLLIFGFYDGLMDFGYDEMGIHCVFSCVLKVILVDGYDGAEWVY